MTARNEVLTLLQATTLADTANIIEFSRDVDGISKPTVMIRIDEVRPSALPNIIRTYKFALIAMVPQTAPGIADAALDDLLEEVLDTLEGSAVSNNIVWTLATRANYENKYPAYQVDIEVHFNEGT